MTNIVDKISHMIESQFPAIYRDEGDEMVAFVKAYYEFLESDNEYATKLGRQMFDANDIDDSMSDFLVHFKEKYLADFPFVAATDKRFLVKHIMDYYRSKGSRRSLELLMRLLFNEEVDVYYPGQDVLRPSDSLWYVPNYIEVTKSARTATFVDKEIIGSSSGAKAFVEGVVTKRVDGKLIDIVYISSVRGNFLVDERVTSDGDLTNAPIITGSMTTLNITLGGRNNAVGDVFDVITNQGKQGQVRVTEIEDATGRVEFTIVDGGYGFTSTQDSTKSDVYISDNVIFVENEGLDYIIFENVVQRLETVSLQSASAFNAVASPGDTIIGHNTSANADIATGTILSVSNTDANGDVILAASANSIVKIQAQDDTTFDDQKVIVTLNSKNFRDGEYVEEGSEVELTYSSEVGTWIVGEVVQQYTTSTFFDADANTSANVITSVAYGTITASNTSAKTLTLEPTWGTFDTSLGIEMASNTSVTAALDSVTVLTVGARALVTETIGANVYVHTIHGTFNANNQIRGTKSKLVDTVSSVSTTGADQLWLESNTSLSGLMTSASKAYANAIVVGQNTTAIGVWGSTNDFETISNTSVYVIETTRDNMISPPRFTKEEPTFNISVTTTVVADRDGNNDRIETVIPAGTFTTAQMAAKGMFKADVTFPATLQDGNIFEYGDDAYGIFLGITDSDANPGQKILRLRAGNSSVDCANSGTDMVYIDVEENDLPVNLTSTHEIIAFVNPVGGTAELWIDGISVGTDTGASTMTKWANDESGGYGQKKNPIPFGAPTNVWKGTLESDFYYYRSAANTNAVVGNIKDFEKTFNTISTGDGADFKIGFIENTETVTLNTDLVGANNVSGIPFKDVFLNGQGAGIGYVQSVTIHDGGFGYSNGEIVTFSNGGLGDGVPYIDAVGVIGTDPGGVITSITLTNNGAGYYQEPDVTLPNATANISLVMEYGYGFEKNPNADKDTLLTDTLASNNFTIGEIATLSSINPGANYNADPFVKVYNGYVASYNRKDLILTLTDVVGSFQVGEGIVQDLGGSVFAKGEVKSFDATAKRLVLERNSFNIAFDTSIAITGSTSAATANVSLVETDETSLPLGDNADIDAEVIFAQGIATAVEVIDSGYGYVDGGVVVLERDGFPYVITATTNVLNQGIGSGYWKTTNSHLNSEKKIHDNKYYQEYSYDVKSGLSLDKYSNILSKVLHVSGNELFGSVIRTSTANSTISTANSVIETS